MRNLTLALAIVIAASACDGRDSEATAAPVPAVQQSGPFAVIHEFDNLGPVQIAMATTTATVQCAFEEDEAIMSVNVQGDYIPDPTNTAMANATAELWLYDTLGDSDTANDRLIGALPLGSPWRVTPFNPVTAGSFTITVPIGSAFTGSGGQLVGTLEAQLRISSTTWRGTILTFRLRVLTLRGVVTQTGTIVQ